MTSNHVLSEQEIADIASTPTPDGIGSSVIHFARAIESAVLAKLSEGVELKHVAYMVQPWNATGTRGLQFDPPPAEPSLADQARGVVYTPLVPLSTAQAAVAAEQAGLVGLSDEECDRIAAQALFLKKSHGGLVLSLSYLNPMARSDPR